MDVTSHIEAIESAIGDSREGLPEPVFWMVSRLTPLLNVDLLVRNEQHETLLTWRDDDFYHGWHVPGGIVRFKERMHDRIAAVAKAELGAIVTPRAAPVAVNEIITPRAVRGHFISFLFECQLITVLDESMHHVTGGPLHGQWAWHAHYPADMIAAHQMYRDFIGPRR